MLFGHRKLILTDVERESEVVSTRTFFQPDVHFSLAFRARLLPRLTWLVLFGVRRFFLSSASF